MSHTCSQSQQIIPQYYLLDSQTKTVMKRTDFQLWFLEPCFDNDVSVLWLMERQNRVANLLISFKSDIHLYTLHRKVANGCHLVTGPLSVHFHLAFLCLYVHSFWQRSRREFHRFDCEPRHPLPTILTSAFLAASPVNVHRQRVLWAVGRGTENPSTLHHTVLSGNKRAWC